MVEKAERLVDFGIPGPQHELTDPAAAPTLACARLGAAFPMFNAVVVRREAVMDTP